MTTPPCGDPTPHAPHTHPRPGWPHGWCPGKRKEHTDMTEQEINRLAAATPAAAPPRETTMAESAPAADWSWQDDPDVISWDWRQGPDLDELGRLLARHRVTVTEVDTGTDDVAVRIGSTPVEVMEDALCRRVWAAALRWAANCADEPFGQVQVDLDSTDLRQMAGRIEAGTLTPWAETPADPPRIAVEPPAAPSPTPGAHGAAPDAQRPQRCGCESCTATPAGLDLDAIAARNAHRRCHHCDMPLDDDQRCPNCGSETPDDIGTLVAEVRAGVRTIPTTEGDHHG